MNAIRAQIETEEDTSEAQIQARVVWYHYVGELDQQEIADRMGLTRNRVNRLVGPARADGLARIEVRLPLANCVALVGRERGGGPVSMSARPCWLRP
jgi:DNA-binding transcriptional regulator LsrR (DeoR family)